MPCQSWLCSIWLWSCDLIAVWFDHHHHIKKLPLNSVNCPLQVVSDRLLTPSRKARHCGRQHERCPQSSGPFCRPTQRNSPFGAVSTAKVLSVASAKWPVYSQWVCVSFAFFSVNSNCPFPFGWLENNDFRDSVSGFIGGLSQIADQVEREKFKASVINGLTPFYFL